MRKTIAFGMAALMTLLAFAIIVPTGEALTVIDDVDVGDVSAESGHNLVGWGPALAPSGGWGGAAGGILDTDDNDLRVTWGPNEDENGQSASLTLTTGDFVGITLTIIALDGIADDSFEVYIDDELVYDYSADQSQTEYWVKHGIPVHVQKRTTITLTITATGEGWSGRTIYGQLAISYVALLGFESGFDEFGYNYQAHMFNGIYSDADRVHGGPYSDVHLMMKWSDTWLSNQDRNGDGELDRGIGPDYSSSAAEGAWLTNHQRGVDENGKKWTYFVKIVYPTGGVTNDGTGHDVNTGAPIIWGSYIVVKRVYSGSGSINYVNPQGWGAL
jgi:hypothetical protein